VDGGQAITQSCAAAAAAAAAADEDAVDNSNDAKMNLSMHTGLPDPLAFRMKLNKPGLLWTDEQITAVHSDTDERTV